MSPNSVDSQELHHLIYSFIFQKSPWTSPPRLHGGSSGITPASSWRRGVSRINIGKSEPDWLPSFSPIFSPYRFETAHTLFAGPRFHIKLFSGVKKPFSTEACNLTNRNAMRCSFLSARLFWLFVGFCWLILSCHTLLKRYIFRYNGLVNTKAVGVSALNTRSQTSISQCYL